MIVNDNTNVPLFFGREEIRYRRRVYGGLLFTYEREATESARGATPRAALDNSGN